MQRASQYSIINPKTVTQLSSISDKTNQSSVNAVPRLVTLSAVLAISMIGLSGCQTIKNLTGQEDYAVATAAKSDADYYEDAINAIDKGRYVYATEQLGELRTFYPTGAYSEQALLDLMYSQFQAKEYELATASAERFIKLYPRNAQVDYAYYVRGVANMQAGNSALINYARLNQAHRDTAYYRLAFNNFQELITRYPNSAYAPDAAQRITFIYNQLAESELTAARWYVKREAYVAAANRAKWVFQYYPLSAQTPEAIAILAYSNEQLGLTDLAQQYKTLLQINYPSWIAGNGKVKLDINRSSNLLNTLTFGLLGRAPSDDDATVTTPYTGATKTQEIQRAAQLQLPNDSDTSAMKSSLASFNNSRTRGIQLGLGLPEEDSEQITSPASTGRASRSAMPNDNLDSNTGGVVTNPSRRTTVPVERVDGENTN